MIFHFKHEYFALIFFCCFFILACKHHVRKPKRKTPVVIHTNVQDTVLLVAMGLEERSLIPEIKNEIFKFYKLPTKYIETTLPSYAYYKPRNRYRADSLIGFLSHLNPLLHYKLVAGITSRDISTTKGDILDYGIFGLGSPTGKACITSTYRLKKNETYSQLKLRLPKVIIHEIGHTFGLKHCNTADSCLMKDARGKLKSVDEEPLALCSHCEGELKRRKS